MPIRWMIQLSHGRQLLLGTAIIMLALVRCGMRWRILTHRGLLHKDHHGTGTTEKNTRVEEETAWAVESASQLLPGVSTCLAQAITLRILLQWQRLPAMLRLGVKKGDHGQVQAHAWVERGGKILIGGSESMHSYHPLMLEK